MEQALIEYIANSAWQAPLLAGGAWLLLRIVQPGPLIQHRVWLAVLALTVLLPMHGIGRGIPAVIQVERDAIAQREPQQWQRAVQASAGLIKTSSGLPHRLSTRIRTYTLRLPAVATHGVVGFYLAAVLFGFARMVRAWRAARRFVERSSRTSLPHRATSILEDYCRRYGMKSPLLRLSGDVLSPAIVGVVRPALLLPEDFNQHTDGEVEAALLHELAHVRRRDYLVSLVCQVSGLPVAWHPVVYGVHQRIRRTREMVCDSMAAREMRSEMNYARCLITLSQGMLRGRGAHDEVQAMGLFDNNILEERLMRLMATKTARSARVKVARAVSGGALVIAATAIAVMFRVTPIQAQSDAAAAPNAGQSAPAASPATSETGSSALPMATAQDDKAQPVEGKRSHVHRSKGAAVKSFAIRNDEDQKTSPEQQSRIEREMAQAQRQMAEATAKFNSPEFREQMAQAQRQAAEAMAKFNSPEFREQMAQAQRQAAEAMTKFNSHEFKKQMAEAQRQAAEAAAKFNAPEFRERMVEAQRKAAEAAAKFNTPGFREQMVEAQRKAAEAAAKFNTPEFRERMAEAQRKAAEAAALIDSPEFKQRMKDAEKERESARKEMEESMKLKSGDQK